MFKIEVKGLAYADIVVDEENYLKYENLSDLDGIECDDVFSEYFGEDEKDLIDKVTGGLMSFKYEDGQLLTYTEYLSDTELTEKELNILLNYTVGQWSDGIGEGFEQIPAHYDDENNEIYISPYTGLNNISIRQYQE